ncbi:craniofacial development protein 1 [Chironomus tepperi]|uniref:craniofacial development protein 1 n=1 Tax=Chironomus tepperi TaxID=113505 RepID=UPI00391FAC1D
MNIEDEDLGSDSDSDDCDYCPVNDSGSDSIDEKDEINENNEGTTKPTKKKRRKGRKTRNKQVDDEIEEDEKETIKPAQDPEKEKERVDALWADFLSGTEIPLEKKETSPKKVEARSTTSKTDIPKVQKSNPEPAPKIFEFAGETIVVSENNTEVSSNTAKPVKPIAGSTSSLGIKRPSTGGLSSVLNQLSKKNKLSVLEKTKLDWDGFKSKEGINEELKTHNRGKDGFLERRDFLERTDYKQFEIEKSLRMSSKRSNK